MRLSLCIATFNEEKFIHYPLGSAYDFVDEIVIVDGSSTDNTVEKAKAYGKKVKVFVEDNPPMFHINKQKAIERAKGEWVLQLDADEELTEELKKEINSVISNSVGDPRHHALGSRLRGNDNIVAYKIPRKNYFLGRFLTKGGVYPDYTIRLYKNGKAKFPCKTVHENVEVDGEVGTLKNDLLHYADPEFSRYLKRWHRYNNLDVMLLKKEGKTPNVFDYLLIKPIMTFIQMFGLSKGFMDGWQGFVFAFFSSIRFWEIYIKTLQK
jgi:glycosyltransferase involved in cell wall biosynthesis